MLKAQIPDDQEALISDVVNEAYSCCFDDGLHGPSFEHFISQRYYLVPKDAVNQPEPMSSVLSAQPDGTEWQPTDGLPLNKGPWW